MNRREVFILQVNIRHQVSPYLVFFIIYSSQVGVGILSFQRVIANKAGYDGWIGILIAGCFVQLLIWMMFKLLEKADGDIVDVHSMVFGTILGKCLSFIFMVYYWLASLSVLLGYVEIVQVWMFPGLSAWIISIIIMALVYYCISGGFRVVVGLSFLSCIYPQLWLIIMYVFPLKMSHFSNLLPFMNHSFMDLADAVKSSMYSLAGTETLLMFYPFIRKAPSSRKFAHCGVLFTTLLYTLSAIVSFTFYSEKQLASTIWPELSITKVIKFSYLERFEYLYISMYIIIVISLLALLLWCSSRGLKKVFNKTQKTALLILCLFSVILSQFIKDPYKDMLDKIIIQMNLWLFYAYIPALLLLFTILKRGKKNG
jgi:spore germination protein (amino acid permease)